LEIAATFGDNRGMTANSEPERDGQSVTLNESTYSRFKEQMTEHVFIARFFNRHGTALRNGGRKWDTRILKMRAALELALECLDR
jgi:hypothetical protein